MVRKYQIIFSPGVRNKKYNFKTSPKHNTLNSVRLKCLNKESFSYKNVSDNKNERKVGYKICM